jgi:toxin-antitoxin system PIN domain toxin
VIAVDTNVLVYAHRADSEWHATAAATVKGLAEGKASWAIPWPCLHEFLAIVTHPRIYAPPSSVDQAVAQVDLWLEAPGLVLLAEGDAHWPHLRGSLGHSQVRGPQVHDARIAALCAQHGVRELWTADRDFSRFTELRTRNPLIRRAGGR